MPRIDLRAADGAPLEGRLTRADEPIGGVAVLCHPHPRLGGSMDSWMMPVLARALNGAGWHALRFDLRAAREDVPAEQAAEFAEFDLLGAIEHGLTEVGGDAPLLLGGWSFGARVSLRHALDDDRVAGWFGIGLPVDAELGLPPLDTARLRDWAVPKLLVHGTEDEFTPVATIEELAATSAEPTRLRIVEGGDHLLHRHGDVINQEVRTFGEQVAERVGDGGR